MISNKTYTAIDGRELPMPHLDDLRTWLSSESHWADLPKDRQSAVEGWWINADHPGFGLNAFGTVGAMRDAGFPETEIREYLVHLLHTGKYFTPLRPLKEQARDATAPIKSEAPPADGDLTTSLATALMHLEAESCALQYGGTPPKIHEPVCTGCGGGCAYCRATESSVTGQRDYELVIEHYRRLVGALLEHSWIDHEGTEIAIADFNDSNDRAVGVLQQIQDLQKLAREENE